VLVSRCRNNHSIKSRRSCGQNRTVETESTVTTAKGWETVEFDFAKQVSGSAALNLLTSMIKLLFSWIWYKGTEKIYYFDDVKMVEIAKKPELSYGVASQTYQ
jgi:hypothetical protein